MYVHKTRVANISVKNLVVDAAHFCEIEVYTKLVWHGNISTLVLWQGSTSPNSPLQIRNKGESYIFVLTKERETEGIT